MSNSQANAPENPYPEVVYQSFLKNSVRSALLIDDQFPMFDTLAEELNQYNQTDRAKRLYRTFKERKIICDIESRSSELLDPSNTDRLLKSDLVVLDYHLNKGDENPQKALAILKSLAESKHFNVVALYTASDNLEKVWMEVAATLKGGWKEPEALLPEELHNQWFDLKFEEKMPEPSAELLVSYLENGVKAAIREQAGKDFRNAFLDEGVTQQECKSFMVARVSQEFNEAILNNQAYDESPCNIITGSSQDPLWVQSGNLFVAIMSKIDPGEEEGNKSDPERIWERLTAAIKDWHPNLLQIMLSEIQNILEVEGVTIDPDYAGSPELQAGILFTLFDTIPPGEIDTVKDLFHPAIEDLTWKLVESIRRKISTNRGLVKIAEQLVSYEISKEDWGKLPVDDPRKRTKNILKFIKNQLVGDNSISDPDLFFELNAFLSSDAFRGSHLTTGTVFKLEDHDDWWMCCSPACDMEPRSPNEWKKERGTWHRENHPTKKMVALRLGLLEKPTDGLTKAHLGKRIFIKHGDLKYQFHVLDDHNHPNWEMLLLDNSDKVLIQDDALTNARFQAHIIVTQAPEADDQQQEPAACKLEKKIFCVIAQLRPEYANRILQLTGHHLSRIGVDFISQPH